jgi:hypothetical protein
MNQQREMAKAKRLIKELSEAAQEYAHRGAKDLVERQAVIAEYELAKEKLQGFISGLILQKS